MCRMLPLFPINFLVDGHFEGRVVVRKCKIFWPTFPKSSLSIYTVLFIYSLDPVAAITICVNSFVVSCLMNLVVVLGSHSTDIYRNFAHTCFKSHADAVSYLSRIFSWICLMFDTLLFHLDCCFLMLFMPKM